MFGNNGGGGDTEVDGRRLAFGEFVFDATRRQVLRADGGEALTLTPRLINALEIFVRRPGELIHKDALLHALWPGRVVEENSLSQLVHGLRRALGDDSEGRRYIQTEARRGFRLVVPVRQYPVALDAAPTREGASARAPPSTLAVLPFVSLTSQAGYELLEVGMADSLISRLSTVPGLVLRSIGSVRRFAEPSRDPVQAAHLLDAAWILDGTLQQFDDQLRVSARLLSMPGGMALWSGSFNVAYTHVFDAQDLISEQVAQALAPRLGGQAPWAPALAAARLGGTRNIDAYQDYLAAQQHAQGVRADGLARSIELYRQALVADEGYALAHVGIAESCRRMIFGADGEPREVLDLPRQHVLQALEISPDLAEAHAQLAFIRYWYDYEWLQAEQGFRLALALNSNVAPAHFGLGLLLATQGRTDEGLAHLRTARELDPMSLLFQTMEAALMADDGDVAAGRARLQRVLQIEPRFWIAHMAVGAAAFAEGDHDAAIAALRSAESLADRSTQSTALLGAALARGGRPDEARVVLARLQELARVRYVPPTSLAAVHAALGEATAALDALDCAYAVRDTRLVYLKVDRRWQALHGEPRFVALLERMRLHGLGPGLNPP